MLEQSQRQCISDEKQVKFKNSKDGALKISLREVVFIDKEKCF